MEADNTAHLSTAKPSNGGFSVVFFQQFPLHSSKEFHVPAKWQTKKYSERELYDKYYKQKDNQWPFISQVALDPEIERSSLNGVIDTYEIKGFDFVLHLTKQGLDSVDPLELRGYCRVGCRVFLKHTVSLTYRFVFNGEDCSLSREAKTEDLVGLLRTWVDDSCPGEVFWDDDSETASAEQRITAFLPLDVSKDPTEKESLFRCYGSSGVFWGIAERYHSFILRHCTRLIPDREMIVLPAERDLVLRYGLVDVWEDAKCLSDSKKGEIMRLMTLAPDSVEALDEGQFRQVCGDSVSCEKERSIYVGKRIAVMFEKACRKYASGTSPSFILLLEDVLFKKHTIRLAKRVLTRFFENSGLYSENQLILTNSRLSLSIQKMMDTPDLPFSSYLEELQFDRIQDRLVVAKEQRDLYDSLERMHASLQSISNAKSSKSESVLNIILAFISVASAFQLLFQTTNMPFLKALGVERTTGISVIVIFLVAVVAIFAVLTLLARGLTGLYQQRKYRRRANKRSKRKGETIDRNSSGRKLRKTRFRDRLLAGPVVFEYYVGHDSENDSYYKEMTDEE